VSLESKNTDPKGQQGKIAPNILERNFKAAAPNQWATDITEFNVSGNIYSIIDLFNQEIVSYDN
jgi:transposase InsO family protein